MASGVAFESEWTYAKCDAERARHHREVTIMDDLKQTLDKLREELVNAGKRLADLADKGKAELPAAAKRIDEEYQRLQKLLDSAVDKLRNR
jgi:hypothetical protein